MAKALEIGDTDRTGTFQIMDTNWDGNGGLRVTVRDNRGTGNSATPRTDLASMRRLARRASSHPEDTKRSPVIRRFTADGADHITFNVSRIA